MPACWLHVIHLTLQSPVLVFVSEPPASQDLPKTVHCNFVIPSPVLLQYTLTWDLFAFAHRLPRGLLPRTLHVLSLSNVPSRYTRAQPFWLVLCLKRWICYFLLSSPNAQVCVFIWGLLWERSVRRENIMKFLIKATGQSRIAISGLTLRSDLLP